MKDRWLEFLNQWRDSIPVGTFPRDAAADSNVPKWEDSDGAKDAQIAATETRLGISLPHSYRAFLQVSNGLVLPGSVLPRLLTVEEIDWLSVLDPEAISAWKLGISLNGPVQPISDEEYFVYGEGQDPSRLRPDYLETALQISDKEAADTAIYLLNPEVIDEDGEWEAWSFAQLKAGADRYRSFWDLMQSEYYSLLNVAEQEAKRPQPGDEAQMLVAKLPDLAEELHSKVELWENLVSRRDERGILMEIGYNQAVLEGLQYAERCVREIGERKVSPEILHAQLEELTNELQAKWQDGVKVSRGDSVMSDLLSGSGSRIAHLSGTAEGYRQALGIIRWFIHEQ